MSLHRFGVGLRHRPAPRGRRMAKLKKEAADIKHEFAGDARFHALRRELDRVCALTESNRLSNTLGYGRESAFENLVWGLVSIFRNHFPKLPLFMRDPDNASNVTGPFINFAKVVLTEFRIEHTYSPRAVADAVTKTGASGKKRKK